MTSALVGALLVASGLIPLFPRHVGAAQSDQGLRFIGEIPDLKGDSDGSSFGALMVDDRSRVAFVWREANPPGGRSWDAYDLDQFPNGVARRRGEVRVLPPPNPPGPNPLSFSADPQRLLLDAHGTEPMTVVDPERSRLMYVAKGAVYEVQYDPATFDPSRQKLTKWVAAPHPGTTKNATVDGGSVAPQVPSGPNTTSTNNVEPLGMSYRSDAAGQRLYVAGFVKGPNPNSQAVVVSAWDAAPNTEPGTIFTNPPQRRDLWTYVPRSCRRPLNAAPVGHALVMRTPTALYLTCDASPDGTSKGILRLELHTNNPLRPGEMAPTGTEEFFPGIIGQEVEVYGDSYVVDRGGVAERRERIYAMSFNERGRSRRVTVWDSSAGEKGAYVGVFPVANPPDPPRDADGGLRKPGFAAGVVNPVSGRWYFQTPDGLRYQDGRLSTVPQSATVESDLDHPSKYLLLRGTQRAPRVDPSPPGGRPPRVIVWHPPGTFRHVPPGSVDGGEPTTCKDPTHACWMVYEDTNPLIDITPGVNEFTLDVPESTETSGAYAGTTSGYGVRVRFVRGLSSLWPSSIAGLVSFEPDKVNSPPRNPNSGQPGGMDWQADPFAYHASDCYARDFEVTLSRVFESVLDSDGVETDGSIARALALDPDAHRKNQDDDASLRKMLEHPDPTTTTSQPQPAGENPPRADPGEGCLRQFLETMAHPEMPNESDPEDGNLDEFGQEWPYQAAACNRQGTNENVVTPQSADWGRMLPLAVSGHALASCSKGRFEASQRAMARSTLTPMQLSPLVTVQDVLAETSSERLERNGLRSTATSVVRGLTLFGLIHLEEIRTVATVHAPGYRRDKAGDQPAVDATADSKRTFIGLSLTDPVTGQTTRVCTVCEDTQVVEAINTVLGSSGYARAPDPDPDYKLGTVKGTNAVVQKDRLQQTADIIGNNDDSSEWPALEMVIYRDAERRGSGRWIIQVGGVFSQANFNVISRLGDIVDEPPLDEEFVEDEPVELLDEPFVEGSVIEGTPSRRVAVRIEQAEAIAAPSSAGGSGGLGELFKRIVEAVTSLKGALLLAVLWLVVFGPVYVARRRALLQRVIGP